MTHPNSISRRNIYLACEDIDLVWDESEVSKVCEMWQRGISTSLISAQLNRDADELTILLVDLARKERITPRPNGAYGGVV